MVIGAYFIQARRALGGQGRRTTEISLQQLASLLDIQATLSAAEVKTLYESNSDTNAFTDADHTKLDGIESGATADQSNAEIQTAYNAQVAQVSQAEAEAGTVTDDRRWTPERVKQAIDALGGGGSSTPIVERDWETIERQEITTGVATVEFSGFDETLYDEFELVGSEVTQASDGVPIIFRTSTDGGSTFDNGATDYAWALERQAETAGGGSTGDAGSAGDLAIRIMDSGGNAAGEFINFVMRMGPMDGSEIKSVHWRGTGRISDGNEWNFNGAGSRLSTTAVDAFQLLAGAGNIDGGVFTLRGRRKNPLTNAVIMKNKVLHVRDEKADGNSGGASVAATDNVRDLNTVLTNEIPGASVSANQVTLQAGTYHIWGRCPGFQVNGMRAIWYNVTDAANEIIGGNMNSPSTDTVNAWAWVSGRFTITAQKVFELRMHTITAKATNGLGTTVGDSTNEVFSEVWIERVDQEDAEIVTGTLHLQNQQTAGTDGGGYTSGSWATVTLNTEVTDTIGVTVASSEIPLAAGTYEIEGYIPFYRSNRFQSRLYNVTDAAAIFSGSSGYSANTAGENAQAVSVLKGRFTLAATKTIRVESRVQTTIATNGAGVAGNFGSPEVYADVTIRRLST